jgi:hypothetical protein
MQKFGRGYGNVSKLKKLRFNLIKLDRIFCKYYIFFGNLKNKTHASKVNFYNKFKMLFCDYNIAYFSQQSGIIFKKISFIL